MNEHKGELSKHILATSKIACNIVLVILLTLVVIIIIQKPCKFEHYEKRTFGWAFDYHVGYIPTWL